MRISVCAWVCGRVLCVHALCAVCACARCVCVALCALCAGARCVVVCALCVRCALVCERGRRVRCVCAFCTRSRARAFSVTSARCVCAVCALCCAACGRVCWRGALFSACALLHVVSCGAALCVSLSLLCAPSRSVWRRQSPLCVCAQVLRLRLLALPAVLVVAVSGGGSRACLCSLLCFRCGYVFLLV